MLSGLSESSASTAVSMQRAISLGVWDGSKIGSGPVGWMSTCLSLTTTRAMAVVEGVGVSAWEVMVEGFDHRILL